MLTSVSQQPLLKQGLSRSMEGGQSSAFATAPPFSTSSPQSNSSEYTKPSVTRRKPPGQASKEGPPSFHPARAGERFATSRSRPSKEQAKGAASQPNERRKRKHSAKGPALSYKVDRSKQSNKAKRDTSSTSHTAVTEKESGQQLVRVKVTPVASVVVADTTQSLSEGEQDRLSVAVSTVQEEELTSVRENSTTEQVLLDLHESSTIASNNEAIMTMDLSSVVTIKVSSERRSSITGSDVDEELFLDALSYLPARLNSGLSSTRSSAFVTPASTRSQSPVSHTPDQSNGLETMHSLESVQESLEQLKIEQELNLFNRSNTLSQEDSPSCGSHVTLIDDHTTELDNSSNCPYTFVHSSQIHNETQSQPLGSVTQPFIGDTVLVGDIEVEVSSQKNDAFELPSSPVEFIDEERDSGCSMSIGSPSKSSLKIKSKRLGHICVTKDFAKRGSFEFSSLSTASPQSSISSSSPLSLSPSPTPPLMSQNSHTGTTTKVFQEWPDFVGQSGQAPHPVVPVCTSLPRSNGGVSQPHSKESHQPTPEDILRMEQWRTNLLAQLRQQQEKLDQKKKQKEQESSFPPPLHMFLPHQTIPPLPPHGSLPLLPPNGILPPPPPHRHGSLPPPPPHGSLPPPAAHGFLPPPAPHGPLPLSAPHRSLPPPPPHGFLPPQSMFPPLRMPTRPPRFHDPAHEFFTAPPHPPQHLAHMFDRSSPPHAFTQPVEVNRNSSPPSTRPSSGINGNLSPPSTRPSSGINGNSSPPSTRPSSGINGNLSPPSTRPSSGKHQQKLSSRAAGLPPAKSHTHPLCDKWVLWFDKISMGSHKNSCSLSDYKDSLQKICAVSSVEEFWRLFNNIKRPSTLDVGTNYHFFKEGVQPLWEDPANKKGGKWVLSIKDFVNPLVLDRSWLEVLVMLIGGCAVKRGIVNGVVVSRRGKKGNKIAIWTSQTEMAANLELCKELIEALVFACAVQMDQLPTFVKHLCECKNGLGLVFMHNTDSLRSKSSYQNESHIKLKDHVQDLLRDLGCR